ncbi:restriction endonuclease [Chryseobacterium oranimense]|uniref:restriction endonuclease n=1 Tax=Chryseobacterium oranimense TaxID=421058 RepID=UPI0031D6375B
MTNSVIKRVINNIISISWFGKIKLDDLIVSRLDEICDLLIDKEKILDELGDPTTKSFDKFVKIFKSTINHNKLFIKVEIFDEIDGIYIIKVHNNVAKDEKYKEVINYINSFENSSNKGISYEKFCKTFLEDLGINCEATKVSGDKGIDILGSYFADLKDNIANLVFNENIYMLIQTKYFSSQIDTPVIRKLVGDSIFIRFDELEYLSIKHNAVHLIVFSHNGFTQPAREFAVKNKVKLFDSTHIAHIIAEEPTKTWNCLKLVFH